MLSYHLLFIYMHGTRILMGHHSVPYAPQVVMLSKAALEEKLKNVCAQAENSGRTLM